MSQQSKRPMVGVVADTQLIEPHIFHTAGDKYLRALAEAADVIPVILPTLLTEMDASDWFSRLDGIFLTGAYSMADPALYGETPIDKPYSYDANRDRLAKLLIDEAINTDLPMLAVCRGFQDINVALGGTLHQAVEEVEGLNDHREDKTQPLEAQYADAHPVALAEGGRLAGIYDKAEIRVNSLHSQGVARLAEGLRCEATAPDGLVEALSVNSMTFGVAVQWHPEWKVMENQEQKRLFEAFGDACRTRQSK